MYDILKNKFLAYVHSFDVTDEKIQLKIEHTFQVVQVMDSLTESLHLNDKQKEIARIIALFHDIGRFEQVKKYHTFVDANSVDHADLGCQILLETKMLEEEEELILCAIRNHNKLRVEPGLDAEHRLMCALIRDADKCDIFRVFASEEYPTLFGFTKECIEDSFVSEKVKWSLMHHECVKKEDRQLGIDYCLTLIGFFYDLNFQASIDYLMEKKLYLIPFSHLHFTHEQTQKDVNEILMELNKRMQ